METQFLSPPPASLTSPSALQMLIFSQLKLTLSPSVLLAFPLHGLSNLPKALRCSYPMYLPSLPYPLGMPLLFTRCWHVFFSFNCWSCMLADLKLFSGQSLLKDQPGWIQTSVIHGVWVTLWLTHKSSLPWSCRKQVKILTIPTKIKVPGKTVGVLLLNLLRSKSPSPQLLTGKLCIYCTESRITESLL